MTMASCLGTVPSDGADTGLHVPPASFDVPVLFNEFLPEAPLYHTQVALRR